MQQLSLSDKPKLKSLHLKNFRIHEDIFVEFAPGLNVIYGANNSGKTTILRAIRYLANHYSPARRRVLRVGSSECEVEMVLTSGHRIIRSITERMNKISIPPNLVLTNPTPEVLSTSLREALEPLGLSPIVLPGSSMEYWPQFHSVGDMFLVNSTPQEVKKLLSGLSHSEVFERARDVSKSKQAQARAELSKLERQIIDEREKLEFEKSRLDRLRPIHSKVQSIKKRMDEISQSKAPLMSAISELERLTALLLPKKALDWANEHLSELDEIAQKCEYVFNQSKSVKIALRKLAEAEDQLLDIEALEASGKHLEFARELSGQLFDLQDSIKEVEDLAFGLESLERKMCDAKEEAARLEEEIFEIKREAIEGGVCPILGVDCHQIAAAREEVSYTSYVDPCFRHQGQGKHGGGH